MTDRQPTHVTNLDRYGNAALDWRRAHEALVSDAAASPNTPFFLGTTRPDGRPHMVGIGALWYDGDLYFTAGPSTRKARNLAANPATALSARLPGIDLVFEGDAVRVTDAATLAALAAQYRAGGWPAEVSGDALTAPFSAPSAGPPPWHLYRLSYATVFGVATSEPPGATRWRFDN